MERRRYLWHVFQANWLVDLYSTSTVSSSFSSRSITQLFRKRRTSTSVNILNLVATRMKTILSDDVQDVLMLAACLGRPVFSVDLLQHVVWCRLILIILAAPWTLPKKMVSFNFLPRSDRVDLFMIGFIMRRGLFLNTGRWQDDVSPTRDHERRRLWQILSTSQLDTPIVLIVNQLILGGVGKIEHNQAENNKVAALCLQGDAIVSNRFGHQLRQTGHIAGHTRHTLLAFWLYREPQTVVWLMPLGLWESCIPTSFFKVIDLHHCLPWRLLKRPYSMV